jgi:hypothetical protein
MPTATTSPAHAPGPWTSDGYPCIIHDRRGFIIAILDDDAGDDRPRWSEAQVEANGCLIAAAPEMRDALQRLIGHVLHYASMPHAHADAHRDVADARAVLLRATAAQGAAPAQEAPSSSPGADLPPADRA